MINKIIKLLSNPQGALIQAMLDQVNKIWKMDKLLRNMEMPNDADRKIEKLETRADMMFEEIKDLNKIINVFKKSRLFKSAK